MLNFCRICVFFFENKMTTRPTTVDVPSQRYVSYTGPATITTASTTSSGVGPSATSGVTSGGTSGAQRMHAEKPMDCLMCLQGLCYDHKPNYSPPKGMHISPTTPPPMLPDYAFE